MSRLRRLQERIKDWVKHCRRYVAAVIAGPPGYYTQAQLRVLRAEDRIRQTVDPCPSVPYALLNAHDIQIYVANTGMINPFYPEDLEPATYTVRVGSRVTYWDENGERIDCKLEQGTQVTVPKNSIAFVELEPQFNIPQYMVARFNLKVRLAYRGLLLGTGPIIDPGYRGILGIPLHNLTDTALVLNYRDKLIAMEFTKLSPHPLPGHSDGVQRSLDTIEKEFSQKLTEYPITTLDDLLARNTINVKSSLPSTLRQAEKRVEMAEAKAKDAANSAKIANFITLFSILGVVLAGGYSWFQITIAQAQISQTAIVGQAQVQAQYDMLLTRIRTLEEDRSSFNKVDDQKPVPSASGTTTPNPVPAKKH